jgi:heat shock protein HslJ
MARMLRSTTLTGTLLVAAALALAGCATNAGSGGAAAEPSDPVGTWGDATTQTEPSLVLADDGTLTGTDGCNRLRGGWSADGDTVTFDQVVSTRMACEGVDTWLSGLATATISGAEMTVLDASGAELGTLTRSE